jgi:hypothetical protein
VGNESGSVKKGRMDRVIRKANVSKSAVGVKISKANE